MQANSLAMACHGASGDAGAKVVAADERSVGSRHGWSHVKGAETTLLLMMCTLFAVIKIKTKRQCAMGFLIPYPNILTFTMYF